VGWYKRWAEELVRSEVWADPELRHLFGDLLDLAGIDPGDGRLRDHPQNLPLTPERASQIITIDVEQYKKLVGKLKKLGMVAVDNEGFLCICKWKHYQSEYKRQSPYRNVTKVVTPGVTLAVTEDVLSSISILYKIDKERIRTEITKMEAWLWANPGRQMTKRFMTNWINREIEKGTFGVYIPKAKPDLFSDHKCEICGKPAAVREGRTYKCSFSCRAVYDVQPQEGGE